MTSSSSLLLQVEKKRTKKLPQNLSSYKNMGRVLFLHKAKKCAAAYFPDSFLYFLGIALSLAANKISASFREVQKTQKCGIAKKKLKMNTIKHNPKIRPEL